jgi:predicted transcriptional regulator
MSDNLEEISTGWETTIKWCQEVRRLEKVLDETRKSRDDAIRAAETVDFKVTISEVADLTGLPRATVRKILVGPKEKKKKEFKPLRY